MQQKKHQCKYCVYSSAQLSTLKEHERTHTGEKPFKCTHPGCTYATAQSTHLTRHIKIHTGEKAHERKHTGEKPHIKYSHQSSNSSLPNRPDDRPYVPTLPNTSDDRPSVPALPNTSDDRPPVPALPNTSDDDDAIRPSVPTLPPQIDIISLQPAIPPQIDIISLPPAIPPQIGIASVPIKSKSTLPIKSKCMFPGCNKIFPTNGSFETHIKIHTGYKPFTCEFPHCHFESIRKDNLTKHIKSHYRVRSRKMTCEFPGCSESFYTQKELETHELEFHDFTVNLEDLPNDDDISYEHIFDPKSQI